MFTTLEKFLYKLLVIFTECLLFVLVFLVASQILSRELSIAWLAPPDEIISLVFAWLTFIGAGLMVRDNQHLRAGVLDLYFEKRPALQRWYQLLINLLLLFFEVIMFRSSLTLYQLGLIKDSPQLRWSQTLWYFPVLASACLMLFYTLIELVQIIFKIKIKAETQEKMTITF